ncbi:MAG TPA: hypothetical protein VMW89_04070 [Desulfatiglandales bacterium]|nr:hypothetical protein [Desulfatiglandales bacterium]
MSKILRIGKDIKASNPPCPECFCRLQASKSSKTGLYFRERRQVLTKPQESGNQRLYLDSTVPLSF